MSSPTLPRLSLREIAVLVVLMAEARPIANPELKELAGFDLAGEARRTLNSLGYVSSVKVGRVFEHTLEDKGWSACRDLWSVPRPAGAGSAGGALFVLLAGVNRGLASNRLSPADFFVPPPAAGSPNAASADPPAGVESRIRAAYAGLATDPAGWVGLADLRDRVGPLSRDAVDSALVRLAQSPGVRLIPVANLKSLTQRDRDAAIRIGGEYNHVIAIGAS